MATGQRQMHGGDLLHKVCFHYGQLRGIGQQIYLDRVKPGSGNAPNGKAETIRNKGKRGYQGDGNCRIQQLEK